MSFFRMLMAPLLVLNRDPDEAKALLEQLMNPRVHMRREAIEALAEHIPSSGDRYLPELLQALLDDDGDVRACTAHLLGQMGPKAALATTALARALSDPHDDVRVAAAYALGRVGAEKDSLVPTMLCQLLTRKSESEEVRIAAIKALGALGQYATGGPGAEESTPTVLPMPTMPSPPQERGSPSPRMLLTLLLEALQRPAPEERWSAAVALGRLGLKRALPFLHQRFLHDPDEFVRAYILEAIALLGATDPAWVAVFMDGIEDESYEVRLQAAQALASWGPVAQAAASHLCDRLEHETDLHVRPSLLYAIGKIGDPDSLPQLLDSLDVLDIDATYAMELWMALGRLGGPEVVPALLEGTEDPEPSLRGRAALALGHAGEATPDVLGTLQTLRDDPELGVQYQAAQALARLGQTDPRLEGQMGAALAFWAARNFTTMTGTLPLPKDELDNALLMLPGTEECETALEELDFAIAWLQRQSEAIQQRAQQSEPHADAEKTLLAELANHVETARRYMHYQPLAAPGALAGQRMQQRREQLAALHKRLLAHDAITEWHAQLEEALF